MPRTSPRFEVACGTCGQIQYVTRNALDRGHGKYCGVACYNAARTGRPRGPYKSAPPMEKACAACGSGFTVGGRGNPSRRQRFCSIECQRAARYRHGATSSQLSVTDAAYLAGIVDGEGTIMLHGRRDIVAMALLVSNTYVPLLEWIRDRTGVGHIQNTRQATERHKASFFWRCNGDAAESVIVQIAPHLIVKSAQAVLALETQQALRDPAKKADRSWQEDARLAMKAMNKRGT